MLDHWLQSAYEKSKTASQEDRYVRALEQLPVEELLAMTRGESSLNKLAMGDCSSGGSEGSWLDQFQGSSLYDQALAIERKNLELDMAETADSSARSQQRDQVSNERDVLRVNRKMLELSLAESRNGGGEPEMAAPSGAPVGVAQDGTQGAAPETANPTQASAVKSAEATGVYGAVARKFPELARHSDVPAVREKAKIAEDRFEKAHKELVSPGDTMDRGEAAGRFAGGMPGALLGAMTGSQKSPRHPVLGGLAGGAAGALLGGAVGGSLGRTVASPLAQSRAEQKSRMPKNVADNYWADGSSPQELKELADELHEHGSYVNENPGKVRLTRGAVAGGLGALLGSAVGGGKSALIGGLGGAALGAIPKPNGDEYIGDAAELRRGAKKNKTAGEVCKICGKSSGCTCADKTAAMRFQLSLCKIAEVIPVDFTGSSLKNNILSGVNAMHDAAGKLSGNVRPFLGNAGEQAATGISAMDKALGSGKAYALAGLLGAGIGGAHGLHHAKELREHAEKNPDSSYAQFAGKHPGLNGAATGALGGLGGWALGGALSKHGADELLARFQLSLEKQALGVPPGLGGAVMKGLGAIGGFAAKNPTAAAGLAGAGLGAVAGGPGHRLAGAATGGALGAGASFAAPKMMNGMSNGLGFGGISKAVGQAGLDKAKAGLSGMMSSGNSRATAPTMM